MHHFAYRDGVLHAEGVNLDTLAREVGTPFYCYSTATLERHYRVFAGAFADVRALVCYAMLGLDTAGAMRTTVDAAAGVLAQFGGVMLAFAFIATMGVQGVVTVFLRDMLGIDIYANGTWLYDMPGLTWQGPLDAYWTEADPPDAALVDAFRRVLIARCLIRGGFFDDAAIGEAVANAVTRLEASGGVAAQGEAA